MKNNISSIRRFINFSLSSFIIFCVSILSAHSQVMPKMNMDTIADKQKDINDMKNMEMLPMPFFTHMGIPYDVGTYGLRIAALATKMKARQMQNLIFSLRPGFQKPLDYFLVVKDYLTTLH